MMFFESAMSRAPRGGACYMTVVLLGVVTDSANSAGGLPDS